MGRSIDMPPPNGACWRKFQGGPQMQRQIAPIPRPVAAMLAILLATAASAQPLATPAERLASLDSGTLSPSAQAAVVASRDAWRALTLLPTGRWLLVNIPAFEISLYDGPVRQATWRAIVGKPATPTPSFTGSATAVILNPWWDVPASIVAESVGRLVARNPKKAARDGYVRIGDRYRQMPGPANQLGQMKLDFVNAFSVGIHDTPSKPLFGRARRALSHGCIRVDDPFGFAATLLGPPASRDSLKTVADTSRTTQRLAFAAPLPVIVGNFTAEVADDGSLRLFDDVYRRVRTMPATASDACSM
ncbi:hypothetical protein CHU93_04895 [Sandarakinorhabdus cyanobacteriorum]|uniref:L,D-TPase catalytic domain-containing protein n=2 Tax=Sandarakinorhabdus cyanobacteriorum TaxID=1981098 RepID=A0A255YPQ4_9SPHN|nr:hypothetical protein CHU93_04895 [Sandarakinorhabdus cyanobacteriorum]